MVLRETYKWDVRDVPFSMIHFQTYDTPYFTDDKWYREKLLTTKGTTAEDITPFYVNLNWHRNVVSLMLFDSIARQSSLPVLYLVPKASNVATTAYTFTYVGGTGTPIYEGYNYFMCTIPLNTQELGVYTARLYSPLIGEVVAESEVEFINVKTIDEYLYFNFANGLERGEGTTADFPFSLLNPNTLKRRFIKIIEGGIASGAITYESEGETFRDQRYLPHLLASRTYKNITLNVGNNYGVPDYMADCVNSILDCELIYVNGRKILRSSDNVPTVNVIDKNYPLVTISLEVENVRQNPNDIKVVLE